MSFRGKFREFKKEKILIFMRIKMRFISIAIFKASMNESCMKDDET